MAYKVDSDFFLAIPRPDKDAARLFQLIDMDRVSFRKFLPWVDAIKSYKNEEDFLAKVNINFGKGISLNLVIWYQQEIVGMISFNHLNKLDDSADIGYWLGKNYRRRGLMTKAVKGICNIGFSEYALNRIVIRAAIDNVDSNAVAKKEGFTHEGILRKGEKLLDGYHDENIYSLLQDEWRRMNARET
ncbi:acetyltransferase [Liquorilactobacillus aquaticus DSM 21051]|uniref:Acetyltransferase n=2 Tax=Liquorilactobacillus aquaticus TaxID=392566 RepID=A0A0R2CWV3_9LACO|nr:GNAT family protein [Liquorilactobacillus aquaticus]KRM96305.1 acetyltransferase [Liquorilactobacillus aquaticus DSM 21051]